MHKHICGVIKMIHPLCVFNIFACILLFQMALRQDRQLQCVIILFIFVVCLLLLLTHIKPLAFRHGIFHGAYNLPNPLGRDDARVFVEMFRNHHGIYNEPPAGEGTDVHDHAVQSTITKAVRELQKLYGSVPTETDIDAIKKYIFNGYDGDYKRKEAAYSVLRYMEKHQSRCIELDLTDMDILLLVWARINDPINSNVVEELKSNLTETLSDANITLDSPYCLTGRVTRIVQSLESLDAESIVNIKSTETLKDEMVLKVPHLRDNFFKEHPSLLPIYNEDNDKDTTTTLVLKQLQDHVTSALKKEYMATGLITGPEFDRIAIPLVESL